MNRLLTAGIVFLIISVVGVTGYRLYYQPQANPASVLGMALPASASNVQVDVQRHFIEGYDAYVRFDIAPQDLPDFLADPAFEPARRTHEPLSVFWNALRGSTPVEQIASASRPGWWQPEQGDYFLTVYRARAGEDGPDSAWYIIDKSSAQRYTVYVFVSEA